MVRIRQGSTEVRPPKNEAELRVRLKLWGFSFISARFRHADREYLKPACPQVIYDFIYYLLGENVAQLEAKDEKGECVAKPHFHQVLIYERKVRKLMSKNINEGGNFQEALRKAMKDTETRDRYLVTPFALSRLSAAPAPSVAAPSGGAPPSTRKGQQKGKGKGKG